MEAQALSVLDGHACLLGGGRLRPTGSLGGQACLLGGARIRADMRLRSKQQRRVMNAEFSNGIWLA